MRIKLIALTFFALSPFFLFLSAGDRKPAAGAIADPVAAAQAIASDTVSLAAPIAQGIPVAKAVEKDHPIRLQIPSIRLNSPIEDMGLNAVGEMAVPSGRTNDVGWYAAGTVPGDIGSAVLDAHVFAAFKDLGRVPVGADIYVIMASGARLHFRVRSAVTYPISKVPLNSLFNGNDGRYLNLITCAGKLTPDHSTYDHRRIVSASFVEKY